ncbi:MAG TPA: dihydropteroate synthase [Xanthobacteraceae bacterium]
MSTAGDPQTDPKTDPAADPKTGPETGRRESEPSASWFARLLAAGRPALMGVLNVTPDSFSDGGRFFDPDKAVAQARAMIDEGADIIDVGAESTRPYGGAVRVSADEERARLEPVLAPVCALGTPVSIDSMKAEVVRWALDQGAAMVNDVWGLQRDPAMAALVAARDTPLVIMHNRETADPAIDIMADIKAFFAHSLDIARQAGIARDRIVLDPGIGFGKVAEQSMEAIARLDRLRAFGLPLLVGASRKRFIDTVSPAPPDRRLGGSIAAHVLAVLNGAAIIRAHDVAETVQALKIAAAIREEA